MNFIRISENLLMNPRHIARADYDPHGDEDGPRLVLKQSDFTVEVLHGEHAEYTWTRLILHLDTIEAEMARLQKVRRSVMKLFVQLQDMQAGGLTQDLIGSLAREYGKKQPQGEPDKP